MTSIDMQMDGDECWPELAELHQSGLLETGELVGVALLPDAEVRDGFTGWKKSAPVLTLRISVPHPTDPDPQLARTVLVQLKVDMLNMIAGALKGRLEYLEDLKRRGGADS
jgi:hypothetical protein